MIKQIMIKRKEKAVKENPGPIYVTNGAFSGEVNLQWDAVKEALNYIIEIANSGSSWHQVDIISDPQYSMRGLKSGRTYSFRVSAIFVKGQSAWSKPTKKEIK